MVVEFLQNYNGYQKKGEVLEINKHLAEYLINKKIVKISKNENLQNDKNSKATKKK
jgi:hypothetical protein